MNDNAKCKTHQWRNEKEKKKKTTAPHLEISVTAPPALTITNFFVDHSIR
jgi:hypothetical protein